MIILGSSSPRRKHLLKEVVSDFKIVVPDFDESLISKNVKDYALQESKNKALSIKNLVNPNDFVITCDTIVKLNDEILGKPASKKEAFEGLKKLSGRVHQVISGVTIIYKNEVISKEIITDVYFNKLSDELINYYIENENVLDKAGGYAIQDDEKFHLVSKIKGSYTNVVGFPMEYITSMLRKFKIIQ